MTPLLIVVRVGLGLTRENATSYQSTNKPSTLVNSQAHTGIHINISKTGDTQSNSYSMRDMGSVGQKSNVVDDKV